MEELTFAQFRNLAAKVCRSQNKPIGAFLLDEVGYEGSELSPVFEIFSDLECDLGRGYDSETQKEFIEEAVTEAANQFRG